MKVLVLSDIHANYDALKAVLEDAGSFDAVWCLGDVIGYGPEPNECITTIRSLPNLLCVLGNHDVAAMGKINTHLFNYEARVSINWLKNQLSQESIKFLDNVEEKIVNQDVTLVHGSPYNPIWEYVLDPYIAKFNFDHFSTRYCFVGHTHQPLICAFNSETQGIEWGQPEMGVVYPLKEKVILNPGSVGQPRDYDPRASYAVYDSEKFTWQVNRVEYDISAVQDKIIQKNLPLRHAQRLSGGW